MSGQAISTTVILGNAAGPSEDDNVLRRSPVTITNAGNDNCSCAEQQMFERAVARELSGDVDF